MKSTLFKNVFPLKGISYKLRDSKFLHSIVFKKSNTTSRNISKK